MKEVRTWSLEDQYRHLIALGKIGELTQQIIEDKQARSSGSRNGVKIVNRNGRHVLVSG